MHSNYMHIPEVSTPRDNKMLPTLILPYLLLPLVLLLVLVLLNTAIVPHAWLLMPRATTSDRQPLYLLSHPGLVLLPLLPSLVVPRLFWVWRQQQLEAVRITAIQVVSAAWQLTATR